MNAWYLCLAIRPDLKIRIGNTHFDSPGKDAEERKHQSDLSRHFLTDNSLAGASKITSSTLLMFCGDMNFRSSWELEYFKSNTFRDAITATTMNPAVETIESASLGITYPRESNNRPRRSDFILYKGDVWECTHHTYFGNDPIRTLDGELIRSRGRDNCIYPSDHLGVLAHFTQSS